MKAVYNGDKYCAYSNQEFEVSEVSTDEILVQIKAPELGVFPIDIVKPVLNTGVAIFDAEPFTRLMFENDKIDIKSDSTGAILNDSIAFYDVEIREPAPSQNVKQFAQIPVMRAVSRYRNSVNPFGLEVLTDRRTFYSYGKSHNMGVPLMIADNDSYNRARVWFANQDTQTEGGVNVFQDKPVALLIAEPFEIGGNGAKLQLQVDFIGGEDEHGATSRINALTIVNAEACAPKNPIFFRWLNQYGGIDYYMAEPVTGLEQSIGEAVDVRVDNMGVKFYDRGTTHRRVKIEPREILTAGFVFNAEDEKKVLQGLIFSPLIEVQIGTYTRWLNVRLHEPEPFYLSDVNKGEIEFKFILPEPLNQF